MKNGLKIIASLTDATFFGADPSFSKAINIFETIKSIEDEFKRKKFYAFFDAYKTALESNKDSNALIGQSVKNIVNEVGEEYFQEALFHSVSNADSKERSVMLAHLIVRAGRDETIRENFWIYVDLINRIIMTDLKAIKEHYKKSFKKKTGFNPLFLDGRVSDPKYVIEELDNLNPDLLAEKLGRDRVRRLVLLGLGYQDEFGVAAINASALSNLLRAIDFIE